MLKKSGESLNKGAIGDSGESNARGLAADELALSFAKLLTTSNRRIAILPMISVWV